MDTLLQDLKAAVRSLRARPSFAIAAVLTLALGIGANTAIFSVVEAVLLRQLPFSDPERLFVLWSVRTDGGREGLSIPDFLDLRAAGTRLSSMSATHTLGMNLTGDGDPERVLAVRVSDGWFETLGVRPVLGRVFQPGEIEAGAHVVLLTDALWRRRFGGDPAAIGKSILLGDDSYEVVGVLPREFLFPTRNGDLAIPLSLSRDPRAARRGESFLRMDARLKPGESPAAAAAQLTTAMRDLAKRFPDLDARKASVLLVPVAEELLGQFRSMLLLLLGAVGLVLLTGCANLVSLMLAQAAARRREFAIRAALGAVRGRLLQQVFIEVMLLSLAGGAAGVLVASRLTALLISLSPQQIPRVGSSGLSLPVLIFALALSVAAGLGSALLPAFQAAKADPLEGIGDGRASSGPASARARRVLVATEVALTVVLLMLAGLLARSFGRVSSVETGFDPSHVLTARLALPPSRYKDAAALVRFTDAVNARLRAAPGVVQAGTVHALPLAGMLSTVDFTVEGRPLPPREEVPAVNWHMCSPGFLRALGIPLHAGREFDERDTADAPGVILVSEKLAQTFFPGRSAVGERLRVDDGGATPRLVEIIGVVADIAHDSLDGSKGFHAYVPLAQIPPASVTYARNVFLTVRTAGDPLPFAPTMLAALRSVDSLVPASSVRSMDQAVAAVLAPRRFSLLLVQAFGLSALLLAAMGIYALTAFLVAQRRHELSIRLALGAAPGALVRTTVLQAMQPALLGLAAGTAAALVAGRLAAGLLFQVSPADPVALCTALFVLGAAAAAAAVVPARKVARVDPADALRAQ